MLKQLTGGCFRASSQTPASRFYWSFHLCSNAATIPHTNVSTYTMAAHIRASLILLSERAYAASSSSNIRSWSPNCCS